MNKYLPVDDADAFYHVKKKSHHIFISRTLFGDSNNNHRSKSQQQICPTRQRETIDKCCSLYTNA